MPIHLLGSLLERVDYFKYLGLKIKINATSLGPTTLRESAQKQGGLSGYFFDNSITMQNPPQ